MSLVSLVDLSDFLLAVMVLVGECASGPGVVPDVG